MKTKTKTKSDDGAHGGSDHEPFVRKNVGTDLPGDVDVVMVYDVFKGTAQGDPDAENAQRVDSNGHGEVTAAGLKRQIRNLALADGYGVHVRGNVLEHDLKAAKAVALTKAGPKDLETAIQDEMVSTYWDVKVFGGLLKTEDVNGGARKGPVQVTDAFTIDPIVSRDISITRCSKSTEKELKSEGDRNGTMGRRGVVDYQLYAQRIHVSRKNAEASGFQSADLDLLLSFIQRAFEGVFSATGGSRVLRGLVVVKHNGPNRAASFEETAGYGYDDLGVVMFHRLFDPSTSGSRGWTDYSFDGIVQVPGATVVTVKDPVQDSQLARARAAARSPALGLNGAANVDIDGGVPAAPLVS